MGQTLVRAAFYPVDWTLDTLQARATGGAASSWSLKGNFGPVKNELFQGNLPIQGVLPADLAGEFVRNGPNPKFIPKGGYHWFDGDGMLHGLRIHPDGSATYVNRYTQTRRLQAETKANRAIFPRIGEWEGKLGLIKVLLWTLIKAPLSFASEQFVGTANTALCYHAGKLMALVEADVPYVIRVLNDGNLETQGRYDYEGKLKHHFTAHPKVDPTTGELIFFGYDFRPPYCTYSVVSKDGELLRSVPIHLPRPIMMHDFAITEHYSIFLDMPLEFQPKNLAQGGGAFVFNKSCPSRFGVFPRHGTNSDQVVWFEFETGYIFHTVNAWEDGDEVVVVGCRNDNLSLTELSGNPYLREYRMNLVTKQTKERNLIQLPENVQISCEFPTVHPGKLGRKNKYGFCARFGDMTRGPLFDGCIKVDLENDGKLLGEITYGENRFGGECVFVPKKDATSEDDGYLLTFVHDENSGTSQFWVMDAKTMSSDPIAVVDLPQRVPYGFHGIYVSQQDIENQKI